MALAVLVAIVAIAAVWLPRLLAHPFHEDEAIYAAWSLQILRGDFWLSATPVDKSPLTFYPVAASIALFGQHEWAARLPNLIWTGLLFIALWRIAERQGRPGWFPVLLALASPLVWALATSAFTDPAMLALALFALERGQAGRSSQAGFAFALAFLAKPTALFLAPLLLLNLRRESSRSGFVLASAAPLLVAWAWDASRAVPSWWALGRNAYGTLGQAGAQVGEWASLVLVASGAIALIGVVVAVSS
ncbi:MAG TPA: glycosyltransferase family 39 protein, partial [Ardenticatenaceae bacterium]